MKVKLAFKIPMQSEVSKYIREKKNWPQKFCDHYAERFWNFYNSNGWKVSGRAAMKSWESAFNSNWQDLKYKNDIEFLNKCIAEDPTIPKDVKGNAYLNTCLSIYGKTWDKIEDSTLAVVYDYMKERRLILMTDPEKELAKRVAAGDVVKGKAKCIKIIFDRMITNNQIFLNDNIQ
jgi:hypothetical protein